MEMHETVLISVNDSAKYVEGYVSVESGPILPGYICHLRAPVEPPTNPNDGGKFPIYGLPGLNDKAHPPLVAVENIYEGKTINDFYAVGEKIFFRHLLPGDVFWGIAGENLGIGEFVDVKDTGKVGKTDDPAKALGYAYETKLTDERIKIVVV